MNQETLSELLKAVSDSTRRSLLTLLCQQGKTRVTDLARVYDLSLNAISKHIKVLEKVGLVKRETMGRTHWIEADLTKSAGIEEWFTSLKSIWALRLDCLNNLINEGKNNMNNLSCHVSQVINAPIERVFDAWLNPEMLSRFMVPMPGMPEPKTEVDSRQGGRFTIYMEVGEEVIPHSGTYLEVDRPNRLVFSWESPFSADGSTVTLEFSSQDSNITLVMLSHERFVDEESRNNHEAGWGHILKMLDEISH